MKLYQVEYASGERSNTIWATHQAAQKLADRLAPGDKPVEVELPADELRTVVKNAIQSGGNPLGELKGGDV